jgi:hypothetical protein
MGFVYVIVFFRYKSLIPFMYVLLLVEHSGRMLIGLTKPMTVAHTSAGAILNFIVIPLAAMMLILSLWKPNRSAL